MRDLIQPALDALPTPVDCFVRDDDAGWDDDRLLTLLDLMAQVDVPIDLAAIPCALSDPLVGALSDRMRVSPYLLSVHQHGYSHANHEPLGRKCEFGVSRGSQAQVDDILHGQFLLRERFGAFVQPIFTPPWNRCAAITPPLLRDLGFAALSRDRGAGPNQQAVQEIAVDIDWSKQLRAGGKAALADAVTRALHDRAADGQPLGLMLHHAAMNQDERELLLDLLLVLRTHRRVRLRSMRECLGPIHPHPPTECDTTACP